MARKNEPNPLANMPLRYLRLPQDVSWDLFLDPRPVTRWALLNKRGEYMLIQDTVNGGVNKLQYDSWPDAQLGAELNGATYIVAFKRRRVLFRVISPSGTPTWWPVPVLNADESLSEINNMKVDRYEPNAQGEQPKRKQLSGAQKRRRYGKPPARKNRNDE
jgi:hypothetical protein